jgi:hydroxymethylbilane synthase
VRIRIGTRGSRLALYQANLVRGLLEARDHAAELVTIVTSGDAIQDALLIELGGKGLFVKEIEEALIEGRCDIAVHSLKDVPWAIPDGLVIDTFLPREDPRDAFVGRDGMPFDTLKRGTKVGTGSLRRGVQLKRLKPGVEVVPIRGNVETRIRKIAGENLDGVVLACAGLRRLELEAQVCSIFSPFEMIPAVGQGTIAIERRADDGAALEALAPLNDRPTAASVTAERAFLVRLQGSCRVPMGGYCRPEGLGYHMAAFIASPDGREFLKTEAIGDDPAELGAAVAEYLVGKGALKVLENA